MKFLPLTFREFPYLADIYREDASDAIFLAEYPSSNSSETQFQNLSKFPIHDPFPPPERSLVKKLGPHHLMCGWGEALPVTSEVSPQMELLSHWERSFGSRFLPQWRPFRNDGPYIVLHPHEQIEESKQVIDPELLHRLHSKEIFREVKCQQPEILDEVQYPCVMKLSHGYANTGNFFIYNQDDERAARQYIESHWPDASVLVTAIVEEIIGDYCVQFYLGRNGDCISLGFTEQIFDERRRWAGGEFNALKQRDYSERLHTIVDPVAEYLHQHGYFGVVGVDVLESQSGEFFVVDINPRLNGSTPFVLLSRFFEKEGLSVGRYFPSARYNGGLRNLIQKAEQIPEGRVVILSAVEKSENLTIFHGSITAESAEAIESGFLRLTE